MAVAEDLESEEGGSADAGAAVERKDSAACMTLCDDDVAPVEISDIHEMCTRLEGKSMC